MPCKPHPLRVMQAQEFLRGETGRYWVALSLRDAESLRGAMHAAMDSDRALIEGKKAAVGLSAAQQAAVRSRSVT